MKQLLLIANKIPTIWNESECEFVPNAFMIARGHPSDLLLSYFEDTYRSSSSSSKAVVIVGDDDYLNKWMEILRGYSLGHVTWTNESVVEIGSDAEVSDLLIAYFDHKGKPTNCFIGKPYNPSQFLPLAKHQEIIAGIYERIKEKENELRRKLEHVNSILRRAYEDEPVQKEVKVEEGEHRFLDPTDEDFLRWHLNKARELKRRLKIDHDLIV